MPQFQDIVYENGKKVKFGGWLNVRMKLVEHSVISLGQYKSIFKHYLFTKKMWTHKGKLRIVPEYDGYSVMILAFQFQLFDFNNSRYPKG